MFAFEAASRYHRGHFIAKEKIPSVISLNSSIFFIPQHIECPRGLGK